MSSARTLENTRLREELRKLRGALQDLQEDKLIETPPMSRPESQVYSGKHHDKFDSLLSEDIENLCKFDKILDFSKEENSESSLKFCSKSLEKPAENPQLKVSTKDSIRKSKKDPLYDHLLDSSLKFSIDSQSGCFDDFKFKPTDTTTVFDRIQPFTKIHDLQDYKIIEKVENNVPEQIDMACSASFQNPSVSFKTFDNQNLLDEIEKLRQENSKLRDQLKSAQSVKTFKDPKIMNAPFKNISPKRVRHEEIPKNESKTPKKVNVGRLVVRGGQTRSASRSKSKSLTPRDISYKFTNSPLTPKRYRHCNVCDHLLSKGYSTKYCSKHGIPNNK